MTEEQFKKAQAIHRQIKDHEMALETWELQEDVTSPHHYGRDVPKPIADAWQRYRADAKRFHESEIDRLKREMAKL